MKAEKEVIVPEQTLPAVPSELLAEMQSCFGAGDEVTAQDIVIPRISIQQAMSKSIADEKSRLGAIYNTFTEQELGYKDRPMQFVAIKFTKHMVTKQGKEIISIVPWLPTSKCEFNRPDGLKEFESYVYFIIPRDELAKDDCMPARFTFISTSCHAAKRLSSEIARLKQLKIPSWGRYFEMRTKLEKKGTDQWYAPEIKVGEAVPIELQAKAYLWYKTLSSFNTKVEEDFKNDISESVHEDETEFTKF